MVAGQTQTMVPPPMSLAMMTAIVNVERFGTSILLSVTVKCTESEFWDAPRTALRVSSTATSTLAV
jgi:hypothetical protein